MSGIIRVHKTLAKLDTKQGVFTLYPYPQDAPLSVNLMQRMGKELFGYLNGQQVIVSGDRSGDVIYNAHLAASRRPIQDVQIAPESSDLFAQDIQQYFKKDSGEIGAKLNDVGIHTISALYHRIINNYDEEIKVFSNYLEVPGDRIKSFLDNLRSDPAHQPLVSVSPRFPVKRGVNLQRLSKALGVPVTKKAAGMPPEFPDSAKTPDLPSMVDLAVHTTQVKNQGMRGTCVAHAALACLEAEYIKAGKAKRSINLSEQYLYWACKNIDGAPNHEGTFLKYAVEILLNGVPDERLVGGSCTEKDWPYEILPKPDNESQGPPTASARKSLAKNPAKHRALEYGRVKHNSIRALKEALAQGHCVGLSVYTYHF